MFTRLLVWILRSSGSRKQKEQDELLSPLPFTEPVMANEQSFPSHIAEPAAAEDPGEPLRVLRTEDGLVITIGGESYRRLRDINDPRLGQDTVDAVRAVLAFAEGWLPFIQKWSAGTASVAEVSKQVPPPGRAQPAGALPGKPSAAALRPAIREPRRMLELPSLIEEANDLVQRRLQQEPDLADHLITLTAAIDGSLRIYVDHDVFEGVSEITNPRVRALIQDAVRE
jgi:hypothetical protein